MPAPITIAVVSDIHYACAAEQARGDDFEMRYVRSAGMRLLLRSYRRFIWLRYPLRHNHLLHHFLHEAQSADWVVANGDYSCDTAFVGLSDNAACASARECLEQLRERFGSRLLAVFGDHELGKIGMSGAPGGMRLASYHRACDDLGLRPFWTLELGNHVLIGVTSSLIAWPIFEPETLPEERNEWKELHRAHLEEICAAFDRVRENQRVLLFCHDPTALPFLGRLESVRRKLPLLERTIIGHLHSNLILAQSRILAGMPPIRFLGHGIRRMSSALREGRHWKAFRVRLCPSLAGIELLKDGGFLTLQLDGTANPVVVRSHRIPREPRPYTKNADMRR